MALALLAVTGAGLSACAVRSDDDHYRHNWTDRDHHDHEYNHRE